MIYAERQVQRPQITAVRNTGGSSMRRDMRHGPRAHVASCLEHRSPLANTGADEGEPLSLRRRQRRFQTADDLIQRVVDGVLEWLAVPLCPIHIAAVRKDADEHQAGAHQPALGGGLGKMRKPFTKPL